MRPLVTFVRFVNCISPPGAAGEPDKAAIMYFLESDRPRVSQVSFPSENSYAISETVLPLQLASADGRLSWTRKCSTKLVPRGTADLKHLVENGHQKLRSSIVRESSSVPGFHLGARLRNPKKRTPRFGPKTGINAPITLQCVIGALMPKIDQNRGPVLKMPWQTGFLLAGRSVFRVVRGKGVTRRVSAGAGRQTSCLSACCVTTAATAAACGC